MTRLWYATLILLGIVAFHAPQVWLAIFIFKPASGEGGLTDAVFNALLILIWGSVHSILAREFSRKCLVKMVGPDFAKLVYVCIAGITQCLLLYLWRPLSGWQWQAPGMLYWMMAALFLALIGATSIALLSLDYMEALGVRAIFRRMNNQPPTQMHFSLNGPYAHCRHPIYLLTILWLWSGPVMNATKLEFTVLLTVYVLIGTFFEDRDTARSLGAAYQTYRKHVPLLIPRLTPWRPPEGN